MCITPKSAQMRTRKNFKWVMMSSGESATRSFAEQTEIFGAVWDANSVRCCGRARGMDDKGYSDGFG